MRECSASEPTAASVAIFGRGEHDCPRFVEIRFSSEKIQLLPLDQARDRLAQTGQYCKHEHKSFKGGHMHAALSLIFLFFANFSHAQPTPGGDTITAEFSFGNGFMLCAHTAKLPPLETAFDCSSALPVLENVTVVMMPQKTAQVGWYLYSGSMKGVITFRKFRVNYEMLVSLASYDGKKYAFIDGSMIDNVNTRVIYFRAAAEGSFQNLSYMTSYGAPIYYAVGSEKDEFVPMISFGKPNPHGAAPTKFPFPARL